jgi:CheY-like chemotaxis protein
VGRLLQSSIQRLGCGVVAVSDAGEVLVAAAREHPALVVLDRELGGGDGAEVLREIASEPDLAGAKVVFIADFARFGGSPRDFGLAAVCVGKPFDILYVTDVIQQLLEIAPGEERHPRIAPFKALEELEPGDVVLDVGCGRGYSALLAAGQVGSEVTVIGIDWQPESLAAARDNARAHRRVNVRFLAADARALPLADGSARAVISTNTLRYVGGKRRVLFEIARVLAPGGEMEVEEVLLSEDCSIQARELIARSSTNLRGALPIDEYLEALHEVGLEEVTLMNAGERSLSLVTSAVPAVERRLAAMRASDTGTQLLTARVHARKA